MVVMGHLEESPCTSVCKEHVRFCVASKSNLNWHLFFILPMAPLSIFNIIIASIDCNYLPPSMNGLSYGNGCAGAVWQDGSPSKQYCDEDSRFPWWIHCCTWQAGRCIPKSRQLSSNANSINGIWIEDIFYNKNNTNDLRCKNPNYVKK